MFSIIIPLYNKVLCVEKAVRSVWSQTYRDLELIIVSDGSTDSSLSVVELLCSELCKTNIKTKFCTISPKNSGVSTTRNNVVKTAKYPYVCFIDADGWWGGVDILVRNEPINRRISTGRYIWNRLLHCKKWSKVCGSSRSRVEL